jgi:YidC/Oxa1 family membrane protein insertase
VKPDQPLKEEFLVFAGPKKPKLLAQPEYGLGEIVYYGWFWWAAVPLLGILHSLYYLMGNYGIAIILLTVLVRSCMFPLSRKQALGAQKMQELQPEIKKIQEKYKNDLEARGKAQQELFRKHKYNPMGGCLIAFLQLPIFVGLYRALMVDVELRQAPLISESIRWASNLAAPDLLFDWGDWMPNFVIGWLGPYFNLLPVFAVLLFLYQQKKFMPPAADETARMQQKMMQYMMIFMGIMFFKVASGLCLYFIASSLWSIAERQFLPKTQAAGGTAAASAAKPALRVAPQRGPAARDGAPPRKKKSPRK